MSLKLRTMIIKLPKIFDFAIRIEIGKTIMRINIEPDGQFLNVNINSEN